MGTLWRGWISHGLLGIRVAEWPAGLPGALQVCRANISIPEGKSEPMVLGEAPGALGPGQLAHMPGGAPS